MRKSVLTSMLLIAASSAMAADLPAAPSWTPAPVIVAAVYNWTGFYAGASAGYARGKVDVADLTGGVTPGPFHYDTNGGFGGVHGGYNFQIGNFVAGAEGDFSYLWNSGSGVIGSANTAAHQNLTLGNGILADITGRVGYVIGPVLLYGKGGAAWFSGTAMQATTNPGYAPGHTGQFSGWTYGGGAEYKLSKNISLKLEYLHFDFGNRLAYQTNASDLSSPIGFRFYNTTAPRFDTIKGGVNYQF